MSKKNILLIIVLILIGTSIYYLESRKPDLPELSEPAKPIVEKKVEDKSAKYDEAIELIQPSGYLNTDGPITIGEFIGKKVILVDFWTYSCINCQRTLPYLTAWYDKYNDKGLEIIGVHSPEFEFEKDRGNVEKAIERFGIKYPVVQDNDFLTWRAYKNRYWPRKYLIDIDGYIVYDHIGEGDYEETEKKIQELLMERAQKLNEKSEGIESGTVKPKGVSNAAKGISPEIYFGASRNKYLKNGETGKLGLQSFTAPEQPELNGVYFDGEWNIEDEFAESKTNAGRLIFKYNAKDVFMVASSDEPVKVKVLVDGVPADQFAGADTDTKSEITIQEEGLYHIIQHSTGVETHTLELIPQGSGFKAFTFTFG